MSVQKINLTKDPRFGQFSYFSGMANPYAGLTVDVEVTALAGWCKARGCGFFLPFLYCVERAANAVPELRRRIRRDGTVVEYDWCPSSYTLALPDQTYCYCDAQAQVPLEEFLTRAVAEQEHVKQSPSIQEEDAEAKLFLSCLPWVRFTALLQPTPVPADSNPRITWGAYFRQEGTLRMPVSILTNHALADGVHLAAFYAALDREMEEVVSTGPILRELLPAEVGTAVALVNRVFEEFVLPDCPEAGRETFSKYAQSKETELTMAQLTGAERFWGYFLPDGTIAGVSAVRGSRLSLLFVDRMYQRKGIARRLCGAVLSELRHNGAAEVTVNSSLYAVPTYEKLGFSAAGERFERNGFVMIPMKRVL